jgi:biopolymer transport protein ExbD
MNLLNDKPIAAKGAATEILLDMTPLVDLGFLLITFFIFTSTMMEAHVFKLVMPATSSNRPSVAESKSATVILGANNVLFYYEGMAEKTDLKEIDYNELRQKLQVKKAATGNELTVLIKITPDATYQNLVDVLDEMLISNIEKYVVMDPEKEEYAVLSPSGF